MRELSRVEVAARLADRRIWCPSPPRLPAAAAYGARGASMAGLQPTKQVNVILGTPLGGARCSSAPGCAISIRYRETTHRYRQRFVRSGPSGHSSRPRPCTRRRSDRASLARLWSAIGSAPHFRAVRLVCPACGQDGVQGIGFVALSSTMSRATGSRIGLSFSRSLVVTEGCRQPVDCVWAGAPDAALHRRPPRTKPRASRRGRPRRARPRRRRPVLRTGGRGSRRVQC